MPGGRLGLPSPETLHHQVFSYKGVHDALEIAEQVSLNHKVMEIDAAAMSTIKIGTLDTPARSAVLCWKVMLEKSLPKEILGPRQIDNARRLAQEIESLEHQAKTLTLQLVPCSRRTERRSDVAERQP
jgi:hypothetical protein